MTFRVRLASFLVASFAILQILTSVLVYEVTRHQIIAEGERQLTLTGATFSRQLNDVSTRVADDVIAWMSDHEAALPSGADATRSQPEMAALWGSKRSR